MSFALFLIGGLSVVFIREPVCHNVLVFFRVQIHSFCSQFEILFALLGRFDELVFRL